MTAKKEGAEIKNEAFDTKLMINIPSNPKLMDSLKKSLKMKNAIDERIDKTKITAGTILFEFDLIFFNSIPT